MFIFFKNWMLLVVLKLSFFKKDFSLFNWISNGCKSLLESTRNQLHFFFVKNSAVWLLLCQKLNFLFHFVTYNGSSSMQNLNLILFKFFSNWFFILHRFWTSFTWFLRKRLFIKIFNCIIIKIIILYCFWSCIFLLRYIKNNFVAHIFPVFCFHAYSYL